MKYGCNSGRDSRRDGVLKTMKKMILQTIQSLLILLVVAQMPEPPSPSDGQAWFSPRYPVDHAAKTQFSNDPAFGTFVEGRFNGMLPGGEYIGPYDAATQTHVYRYARTTLDRRIKWRYVPLYYYDSTLKADGSKAYTLKLGGYDRRYPDGATAREVQKYWYEMPRPPAK